MPEISRFYGIVIRMKANEHNPPHFHVQYNDQYATVFIANIEIMSGELSPTIWRLVREWGFLHQAELMLDWIRLIERRQPPLPIEPLE